MKPPKKAEVTNVRSKMRHDSQAIAHFAKAFDAAHLDDFPQPRKRELAKPAARVSKRLQSQVHDLMRATIVAPQCPPDWRRCPAEIDVRIVQAKSSCEVGKDGSMGIQMSQLDALREKRFQEHLLRRA